MPVALGVAVLVLPLLALWLLWQELRFGLAAERLAAELDADPQVDFEACRAAVEAAPEDWRAWFALGLAYRAAQDNTRARRAVRRAIALHRGAGEQGRPTGPE